MLILKPKVATKVGPPSRCQKRHARVITAIIAGLLVLQLGIVANAVAFIGLHDGSAFGITCAKQNAADPSEPPLNTSKDGHPLGHCGIFHSCGTDGALPKRQPFVAPAAFQSVTVTSSVAFSAPMLRVGPKGAPQSPRAPPPASI